MGLVPLVLGFTIKAILLTVIVAPPTVIISDAIKALDVFQIVWLVSVLLPYVFLRIQYLNLTVKFSVKYKNFKIIIKSLNQMGPKSKSKYEKRISDFFFSKMPIRDICFE